MTSRQIGNYRIIEYVGGGGFGSVFKAEDLNSPGRVVAIKELHKRHTRSAVMKQRFFQEALAMARLDHPNLPRLYTFGEDNGSYYLVMEFVFGSPLSEEIERGPIAEKRTVAIISQVLEGVAYAHKNGVIHRDLKPDNILLSGNGESLIVKVMDFGIAKMFGGENLTMTGEGFGTPRYMSPERIAGSSELDRRTDIYSVGIILFECLTGRAPFATNSTDPLFYWTEMRRLHESEPIPRLSTLGVSATLEQIVNKAAAKRLEDRYATADEMLAALRGGAPAATLSLLTAPAQAEVYVDDILRGVSSEPNGNILIHGLAPGLHNVRVSKAGFVTYQIGVSLEANRASELQVQLSANPTVAIPKYEGPVADDHATDKIATGDDVKTVIVTFNNLPAGGTLAMASSGPLPVDEDGRATVALTPGVHEVEITDRNGQVRKQTVTVGNPSATTAPSIPSAPLNIAPAVIPPPPVVVPNVPETRIGSVGPPVMPQIAYGAAAAPPAGPPGYPAYPQPMWGRPIGQAGGVGQPVPRQPTKQSSAKWITAIVSVLLFAGLLVAAYLVVRNPFSGDKARFGADSKNLPGPSPSPIDSGASRLQALATATPTVEPSPTGSSELMPDPILTPSPSASPTPSRSPEEPKSTPKPEPSKPDQLIDDPSKPERKTRQGSELDRIPFEPTPQVRQSPTPPPRPSPTRQFPDTNRQSEVEGDACLTVAVTGGVGRPMGGFAITCSELTGGGRSNSFGGRTGPFGRWRQCGMIPGHKVIIQVFDRLGNAKAGRQVVLTGGQNFIEVRVVE